MPFSLQAKQFSALMVCHPDRENKYQALQNSPQKGWPWTRGLPWEARFADHPAKLHKHLTCSPSQNTQWGKNLFMNMQNSPNCKRPSMQFFFYTSQKKVESLRSTLKSGAICMKTFISVHICLTVLISTPIIIGSYTYKTSARA